MPLFFSVRPLPFPQFCAAAAACVLWWHALTVLSFERFNLQHFLYIFAFAAHARFRTSLTLYLPLIIVPCQRRCCLLKHAALLFPARRAALFPIYYSDCRGSFPQACRLKTFYAVFVSVGTGSPPDVGALRSRATSPSVLPPTQPPPISSFPRLPKPSSTIL